MGTTHAPDLTVAVQDYLKGIYVLESAGERVTTSALAGRMGVTAPSATAMTKRLAELGLVERAPYRGVALTEQGKRGALEVLRHHRLLERYLVDRLGLSLDQVHAEAELLEHALSEELEAKIDAELGFPTHDPHGDPIPDSELRVSAGRDRTLADLEPGEHASVSRVPDGDPELLRYL
ncbi:MAG: metal-dependent transcriptional regulator, partial [Gaiellaceae bacterium]